MDRKARGVEPLCHGRSTVSCRRVSRGLATVRIPRAYGGFQTSYSNVAALCDEFGGECAVGHVGVLDDSQEGQRDLIAAEHELTAQDAGWRFVFVGSGADEAMLRELAGDNPAIWFIGHVENVVDHLIVFYMFAFPSVQEGLGSALLDAMHAGLPIVASDFDGVLDIMHNGVDGLPVPARFFGAVEALQRLRNEPIFALRLADAAAEKSLAYTAAEMVDRYLRWYRQLGLDLGVEADTVAVDCSNK